MILRILCYFYCHNPNYVWGVGHDHKCKKGQIKQYYEKSSYETDSAPLKNTWKYLISVEAHSLSGILLLLKTSQVELKYKKS